MAAPVLHDDIWNTICPLVDRATLRGLRCTSSTLCHLATPILFQTIILRANIYSFKRATRIATTPWLSHRVRALMLRDETAPSWDKETQKPILESLTSFETYAMLHVTPQARKDEVLRQSQLYYQRCLTARSATKKLVESDYHTYIRRLVQLLTDLTSLEFLQVVHHNAEASRFAHSRGIGSGWEGEYSFRNLIETSAVVQPISIRYNSVLVHGDHHADDETPLGNYMPGFPRPPLPAFHCLENIHLRFEETSFPDRCSSPGSQNFGILLRSLRSLKSPSLELQDEEREDYVSHPASSSHQA